MEKKREPVTLHHPRMARSARAAQFAPFSALTGYEAAVAETGRQTERRREIDEGEREIIREALRALLCSGEERPAVEVTYFEPDSRKAGGAYVTHRGRVRRIDEVYQKLIFTDQTEIDMNEIFAVHLPEKGKWENSCTKNED